MVCRMREEEERVEKEEKVESEKRKKHRQEKKDFMGTRTNRINAWRDWSKSVRPALRGTQATMAFARIPSPSGVLQFLVWDAWQLFGAQLLRAMIWFRRQRASWLLGSHSAVS